MKRNKIIINDILVVETTAGGSPREKPAGEKEGEQ